MVVIKAAGVLGATRTEYTLNNANLAYKVIFLWLPEKKIPSL